DDRGRQTRGTMTSPETAALRGEPQDIEDLLNDPRSVARVSAQDFATMLKAALQEAPEATKDRIEAMMRRAINPSAPHAFEQFNLTETETTLGTEYSLTLEPGQSLTDVFDASNASFALLANDRQKEHL